MKEAMKMQLGRGRHHLRLLEIHRLEFKQSSPGYDVDSVNGFLDQVIMDMERLVMEIQQRQSGKSSAVSESLETVTEPLSFPSFSESPAGYDVQDVTDYIQQMLDERNRLLEKVQKLRQESTPPSI